MKKVFSTLVVLAAIFFGVMRILNNPGQKVNFANNCSVFYKSGATEADAKAVGDFLVKIDYFGKTPVDVQLTKEDNKFQLKFVAKEEVANKPELGDSLNLIGAQVAAAALNGAPLQVEIVNERLKNIKTLPPLDLGKAVTVGNTALVFYTPAAGEADAKKLADWMAKNVKTGSRLVFRLDKKGDTYEVSIPMDTGDDKKPEAEKQYASIASTISSAVFGGAKVAAVMVGTDFKGVKTVPMAVAEQPPADTPAPAAETPADKTDE